MQKFYIKSGESYCVLEEKKVDMGLISLVQYMVDNGYTTDKKIKGALEIALSFTQPMSGKSLVKFIAFRKTSTKNASHITDKYSLSEVAENFKKLGIFQQAVNTLESFCKKEKIYISSIKTEEFKDYFTYDYFCDSYANNYAYNKMKEINFTYSCNYETRKQYEQKNNEFKSEGKEKFTQCLIVDTLRMDTFIYNHFKTSYAAWKKVLQDDGTPHVIEDDGFVQRFNEKEGYAIFLPEGHDGKNFGFFASAHTNLTDINQAKLFQNLSQANRYVPSTGRSDLAIVKVNVKFVEIVRYIGNIDTSALDAARAAQEKAYLDSLMSDENEVQSLAKKLLVACGEKHQKLKDELNQLIDEKEEVIVAKKKNKI